jgi:positive regulator of sigma E activity
MRPRYVCLGAAELLYAIRRKPAVLLQVTAFLVFVPLICIFCAAMLYKIWIAGGLVHFLMFLLILASILLILRFRRRFVGRNHPAGSREE